MLLGFPRLQSSGGKKGDENRKWIVFGIRKRTKRRGTREQARKKETAETHQ